MSFNEKIILNDGRQMPLLGLGVYKAVGENEVEQAIADAADAGYRLIDTASVYKNEDGVGRGIKALTIPREELFVTTKIWNTAQRIGDVEDTFNRSLERLGLDYVDLYLIHWPVPGCYTDTWKALEKLQTQGRVKSIGVSNFHIHDLEMLKKVGLDEKQADRYPRQLSGGQRQRVCIAESLMLSPRLLIADEPVSALDVTIQAQVISLLRSIQKEMGLAILFISHDMRVVYQLSQRVMIMKDGEIVESGDVDDVYFHPEHPYTKRLLEAAGIESPGEEPARPVS